MIGEKQNKKNKFSLKEEYKKSFVYLRESKKFIYGIILIFFLFALVGFFVPLPEEMKIQILNYLKELLGKIDGMSTSQIVGFIFLNNAQSSFFGLFLGFFFGIFPVLVSLANGFILGFVARLSVGADGILSLWRILPHGIFELPAVFISLGMGMKFGTFFFAKKPWKTFKENFWNSVRVFLTIVIPLLIVAAIIEGVLIGVLK